MIAARLTAWLKEQILQSVFRLSRFGERHGWEHITYHPGVFAFYHWSNLQQAGGVAHGLLETFPDARSFADVGAGTGVYAARLKRAGRSVRAYERSRLARMFARAQGLRATSFDLREPVTGYSDVAYSFEVAEHLPPALGRRLVEVVLGIAPVVVFSAAQPGQGGQGHVNEQPPAYWTAEFERAGARLDPETTVALRERFAAADSVLWIRGNVQVFRRR
jgi:SAM-dependent methyltransferase